MKTRGITIQAVVLCGALVVQYALGMYVNLFVSFPDNFNEGQLWEFAWSQPLLAAHIVLAILILVGAIVLCVRVWRAGVRAWVWPSLIGLLGVLLAGTGGAQFIPSQIDGYSYMMSLGFLIAFAAYCWGLYCAAKITSQVA